MCRKKLLVPFLSLLFLVIAGMFVLPKETSAACPDGSYKRSCNMSTAACDENSITAACKKMDGKWTGSKLNLPCDADIANCNGILTCLCGSNCPSGSYQNSCWCCNIKSSNLYCYCKNKKGKSISTGLSNYSTCKPGEIWNDNGTLKCNRQ